MPETVQLKCEYNWLKSLCVTRTHLRRRGITLIWSRFCCSINWLLLSRVDIRVLRALKGLNGPNWLHLELPSHVHGHGN